MDHESEADFIELDRDTSLLKQHMIVGVIYRPPGTDVNQFNDITSDILERVRQERKLCYLLGDYNMDLLKDGSHKPYFFRIPRYALWEFILQPNQ